MKESNPAHPQVMVYKRSPSSTCTLLLWSTSDPGYEIEGIEQRPSTNYGLRAISIINLHTVIMVYERS